MSGAAPASKSSKSGDKSPRPEADRAREPEQLPRRFGRLTLLRLMARGGMGEVYLASAGGIEGAERPCVVKIIRREHADDKSFLARFLDEARIQAQLHHPGIAQILEATTDGSGKPYVVVEHVEGRNLGEVRNRAQQLGARISWPEAVAMGLTMAEALAHVHERTDASGRPLEIVHRDLSPQNVMVGYAGELKLIDFGTARGENRRCHTVAGIVFAKPGYVAPEVANNTPGGVQADIYALGIMLWELLAGRRFLTGDASEHLAAVGQGRRSPSPIAQLVDAPGELDAVLSRLTATRMDERYASARDAAADLVALLKRAPSLPDGERSVRARIADLMRRLYPSEPARTRAEFARLVAIARKAPKPRLELPMSPPPPAPTKADETTLPGTRYRLLREIGRGAQGVVHEAVHVDLGRSVALKVLPNDTGSIAAAERLRAEARVIARLSHENLVTLHDFGFTTDGRPFYAMELLDGESLDRVLARGDSVSIAEALRIGVQACRALEAAHAAGVVHRDIKPANLFLTRSGAVKLLDFGVAKVETRAEIEGDGEAFIIMGTPAYMAPEQASGAEATVQSDVYALGSVLYELLTSRLPFAEESTVQLLDAKQKNFVEPPSRRAGQRGLSKMVDKTILRALDRDPEKRFESAEEMRQALEAALQEPEIKRRRRRRIGYATIGALMVTLGAGIAVGAKKPEVRERAMAMVQPAINRIKGIAGKSHVEDQATASVTADATEKAEPEATVEEAPAEVAAAPAAEESDESEEAAPAAVAEVNDEEEAAEPAAEASKTAEAPSTADLFAAQPAGESKSGDDVEGQIAKAREMMNGGQKVKGFNELRRLGRNHRKDARVLQAWCEAAIQMKGWGEAYRVSKQWTEVDPSPEARIQRARLERNVGKRDDAIKTLTALLQERPGYEEARHMLTSLTGDAKLAQR